MSDIHAAEKIAQLTDTQKLHPVRHFIYTPTREAARTIAEELKQRGFQAKEHLSGKEAGWLVLARHEIAPTAKTLLAIRSAMEALAADIGGQYDGWEVEIRRH
jgi:hypothetical protein